MWRPILVGVDATQQASEAARTGLSLAEKAGTTCHLVNAMEEAWVAPPGTEAATEAVQFNADILEKHRETVAAFLKEQIPAEALAEIDVVPGRAAAVLHEKVESLEPEMVVLGGKHHSGLSRWIGTSTALHAMRAHDVPVLVTRHPPETFSRVMVAVDLSRAATPTIDAAVKVSQALGAELQAVHVVGEIAPVLDIPIPYSAEDARKWADEVLNNDIWTRLPEGTTRDTLYGDPIREIERAVQERDIDLLVLGSHGMGLVDRILIGSTTEKIVGDLPTSVLVVPVA